MTHPAPLSITPPQPPVISSAAKNPRIALLLLLLPSLAPQTQAQTTHQRYQRTITTAGQDQTCAILDPQTFAHAAPSLKDLRLYAGSKEIPYAVIQSESPQPEDDTARILNLGLKGPSLAFDLEMPARTYTEIHLDLDQTNFIAKATITGAQTLTDPHPTTLGTTTLFDLTTQHLSRSTTIQIQESSFRYLHILLTPLDNTTFNPATLHAAQIPPSREAQTLYTDVAQSTTLTQRDKQTIATFQVPAHVPIENVAVTLPPTFTANFSRTVQVKAHANQPNPMDELMEGTITRVNRGEIQLQQLTFPASLGSNLQHDATVEVAIQNGDDTPLPITSITLQMRRRTLCFDPPPTPLTLYYGDPALPAPIYDYARLFTPTPHPTPATLGPETLNPTYQPPTDTRPFTDRHPELLWLTLLAVIGLLGTITLRTARRPGAP